MWEGVECWLGSQNKVGAPAPVDRVTSEKVKGQRYMGWPLAPVRVLMISWLAQYLNTLEFYDLLCPLIDSLQDKVPMRWGNDSNRRPYVIVKRQFYHVPNT